MIMAPVSIGEVLDKISILEIKSQRIKDPKKIENVLKELAELSNCANQHRVPEIEVKLKEVNEKLWDIEEALRKHEELQDFSEKFIFLARSVYQLNDLRSDLKRQVNFATGSILIEEKSYNR
jgi:hypothetical protein